MVKFNYVSLFSGIGGFEQGLDDIGGNCVMASEIDKFASKAYQELYNIPNIGDIKNINAENIPDHDILVGGFPCQSFSLAGNRGGFNDLRGTMFFEMARIAAEKQPKVFLGENVKGLVGHDKGRTLDTMVKTLNDIGYRIDFEILNSKYLGVPQNRERIFLIGIREDLIKNEPWIIEGNTVVPKGKRRIEGYGDAKTFNFDWPKQDKVTSCLRDILEDNVDEKYYLSDKKTAKLVKELEEKDQQIGTIGHHPFSKKQEFRGYHSVISPSLVATDYKAPKTVLENGCKYDNRVKQTGYIDKDMQGNRVYDPNGIGATISSQTGGLGGKGVSLISEPNMIGHIDIKGHDSVKRVYDPNAMGPTLTTMGGGMREPKIAENKSEYRIRKLTPLECFRLQGFSDNTYQKLVNIGISNSQLYKMIGNAVTVNVVKSIGEKLLPYLIK